mgnify:CR=1 FL=1
MALHRRVRGRGIVFEQGGFSSAPCLADLGYHGLELEIDGFNKRAIWQVERTGFVWEGRRRRAYWRHGA